MWKKPTPPTTNPLPPPRNKFMSSHYKYLAFTLLVGIGGITTAAAMPPMSRDGEGVIKTVSPPTRSFEFDTPDKSIPRVLTWRRRTSFYVNGNEADSTVLRNGQRVELRYRTPFFGPPYVLRIRVISTLPRFKAHKVKP